MADLAFKEKKENRLYHSCCEERERKPEKRFPHVTLPLHLIDNMDIDLDDEVEMTFKGKVTSLEKNEWSEDFTVKMVTGEIKEVKSKKTLAG